jgi:PAS domain S-box-containing protein
MSERFDVSDPRWAPRSWYRSGQLAGYGLSTAATGLGLSTDPAVNHGLHEAAAHCLLPGPKMVSPCDGKVVHGVLTLGIGRPVVAYLSVSPIPSLAVLNLPGWVLVVLSLLLAVLIGWLIGRQRRTEARLRLHVERQRIITELASDLANMQLDHVPTLQVMASRIASASGDGCILRLVDSRTGRLEPVAVQAQSTARAMELLGILDPDPSGVNSGRTANPVISEDPKALSLGIEQGSVLAEAAAGNGVPVERILTLPLMGASGVVGALTVWRETHGRPFTPDDERFFGELAITVGLAIDNARLFREARDAEARYRGIFDGSADAILVADLRGKVLDANKAARLRFGDGALDLGLLSPGTIEEIREATKQDGHLASSPTGCWRGEERVVLPDGTETTFDVAVNQVDLGDRSVLLAMLRDVTERQRLEDIQRAFVLSISHDLKTPITAIQAAVVLLLRSLDDRLSADERQLLGHARASSERLGALVGDLLSLNQLESGTLVVAPSRLDLRVAAERAVASIAPQVRGKKQELVVDLPIALPVCGDRDRLEQVICNLLENAHRHAPGGTWIALSGDISGDLVHLTVADNGPGIPPEEIEAVFERFYRLGDTGTGSGLGLAIARHLAALHNGTLRAENRSDSGILFELSLPLAKDGACQ